MTIIAPFKPLCDLLYFYAILYLILFRIHYSFVIKNFLWLRNIGRERKKTKAKASRKKVKYIIYNHSTHPSLTKINTKTHWKIRNRVSVRRTSLGKVWAPKSNQEMGSCTRMFLRVTLSTSRCSRGIADTSPNFRKESQPNLNRKIVSYL